MPATPDKLPPTTELLSADEALALAKTAIPKEHAEADTLASHALTWALRNAEGRTAARIKTYAQYGRTSIMLKFAPGEADGGGVGNSFYMDLLANSNVEVADAIAALIAGRDQELISPLQEMRLLNEYNAKLVNFLRRLKRAGYRVVAGEELAADGAHDSSTILVSWFEQN